MEMKYVYCEVGIQILNVIKIDVLFCIVQQLFSYVMTRGTSWQCRVLVLLVKKFIIFYETDISGPPTNDSIVASWIQSTVLCLTTIYDEPLCVLASNEFFVRRMHTKISINRYTIIYAITVRSIYKTMMYELPNGSFCKTDILENF
jgi:hypothetical protein